MKRPSILRAIVTGFLIAIVTSIVTHLYYQFLIYHQHQGERALAHYRATGKVDAATFGAFGYNGWITTADLPLDDDGSFITNTNETRWRDRTFTRVARNVVVEVGDEGQIIPVTFDLSYLSRMVVKWHRLTWLILGVAFTITVFAALRLPQGKLIVSTSGWFLIAFGLTLIVGAFVLRGYLGLDGLAHVGSFQVANRIVGPAMALLGFWLTYSDSVSARAGMSLTG